MLIYFQLFVEILDRISTKSFKLVINALHCDPSGKTLSLPIFNFFQ